MKRILRGGKKRDRPKSDAELGEMELTELPSPQSTQPPSTQEGVATATQLESGEEEATPPPSPQQLERAAFLKKQMEKNGWWDGPFSRKKTTSED